MLVLNRRESSRPLHRFPSQVAEFNGSLSLARSLCWGRLETISSRDFPLLESAADETISMTIASFYRPVREAWVGANERCFQRFPCLADPVKRSSWSLKLALVVLHLIFMGCLFLSDRDLLQKTKEQPWYTGMYLALFIAALIQYFLTSSSSPGYVLDAMREEIGTHANFSKPMTSKQTALSKNESVNPPAAVCRYRREIPGVNAASWMKRMTDLYPLGSCSRNWTCSYCNVVQPPRAKHCHDCDKCVLQFDHHCVWLGTCIGQGNHCRFWWFIFEETILCIWTGVFYVTFLKADLTRQWWKDAIAILLLVILGIALIFLLLLLLFHSYLVLTNQTTYELVRRRRISYLRGIPERVHPFSKGICGNLYNFCCADRSINAVEPLPTADELEAKARPYTCMDVLSCRCC